VQVASRKQRREKEKRRVSISRTIEGKKKVLSDPEGRSRSAQIGGGENKRPRRRVRRKTTLKAGLNHSHECKK